MSDEHLKKLIQASWGAYAAKNFSEEDFKNEGVPSSAPIIFEAGYREALDDIKKVKNDR